MKIIVVISFVFFLCGMSSVDAAECTGSVNEQLKCLNAKTNSLVDANAKLEEEIKKISAQIKDANLPAVIRHNSRIHLRSGVWDKTCLDNDTNDANRIQGWECNPAQVWIVQQ